MLNVNDAPETFEVKVLVEFKQLGGTVKQGDFMATFKRPPQTVIDDMLDDEMGNSAMVDEVLIAVSGIGKSPSEPLPPEEALIWVKRTPECVNAAAAAFFRATRPERYIEKTSRKRSTRG